MTKQEKIKKKLIELFDSVQDEVCWHSSSVEAAEVALRFLDSEGVVIKVERDEPISCGHAQMTAARYSTDAYCPLIKAGYVAVEALMPTVP